MFLKINNVYVAIRDELIIFLIRARLELSKNILAFKIDPPCQENKKHEQTCLKLGNMFVHISGQSHVFLSPKNKINKHVFCLKHG
jgi:hypothetical protein